MPNQLDEYWILFQDKHKFNNWYGNEKIKSLFNSIHLSSQLICQRQNYLHGIQKIKEILVFDFQSWILYYLCYMIRLRSKYVYKSLFVTKFSNHINRMAKMKSSLPCNICYNDNSYVLIVQLSFVMLTQKQEAVAKWLRRVN